MLSESFTKLRIYGNCMVLFHLLPDLYVLKVVLKNFTENNMKKEIHASMKFLIRI